MSKITAIHDELVNLLALELPDYKQLPNPYEINANPALFTRQGFGVVIGDAVNGDRRISSRLYMRRNVSVVLIREVTATASNVSARAGIVADLLNEQVKIAKAIESEPTISGTASNALYASDTGPVPLEEENGNQRYFMIETMFTVEYFEPLEA